MQACGYRQVGDNKGHNPTTDDDFLLDIRDYKSMVEFLSGAYTDHITTGGHSKGFQVAQLL